MGFIATTQQKSAVASPPCCRWLVGSFYFSHFPLLGGILSFSAHLFSLASILSLFFLFSCTVFCWEMECPCLVLLPVCRKLQLANVFFPCTLGQWHLSIEQCSRDTTDRHFAQCHFVSLSQWNWQLGARTHLQFATIRHFCLQHFPRKAGIDLIRK